MAGRVFDNVTNWSTYQDRQLAVLTSLEKSFTVSLNMSKMIRDNLSSMQSAMTSMIQSANSLTNYVNNLTSSRSSGGKKTSNARAAREAADMMRRNLEEIHRIEVRNQQEVYENSMAALEEQLRMTREELEDVRARRRTQRDIDEAHRELVGFIGNEASKLFSTLGKLADNYLNSSNNLIKITGSSGESVKANRNAIVSDIVGSLNRETGGVFSPQDSYQKMVSIASEAGIGSLEALREMSRPLLLADESMDANLGDIAKLFYRFYNRYSFSSIEMENIVNEIRGNTAGNAATAQATAENLASLESWISMNAKGDTSKMEEMMKSISQYTSWLESLGVDSSRYTKDLESIAWGDAYQDTRMVMLLNSVGSSVAEAQAMLTEGQWDKVTEMIALAEKNMYEQYAAGSQLPGPVLDALQQDRKAIDTYLALTSESAKTLEEFQETVANAPTAPETIEDKFVSLGTKANNWLESIANNVANIQDWLGISFTDVAAGFGIYQLGKRGYKLLRGSSPAVGESPVSGLSGALTSYGSSLTGATSTTGAMAAGIAGATGVAAGAGIGIYGGLEAYREFSQIGKSTNIEGENTSHAVSGSLALGAGAAGLTGAGLLLASNPVGWAVLIGGGLTLAGKAIYDHATRLSGLSEQYEEYGEQLKEAFKKEQKARINSISDLAYSVQQTESIEEKRNLLVHEGILSEKDARNLEEKAIEDLIISIRDTEISIQSLGESAVDAATKLAKKEAQGQTKEILDELYGETISKLTSYDLWYGSNINKKDSGEEYTKMIAMFEGMAESITNADQKSAMLNQLATMTKDEMLSIDEINTLFGNSGDGARMRQLFSGSIDSKNNFYDYAMDPNSANPYLSFYLPHDALYDLEGVTLAQKSASTRAALDEWYRSWDSAADSTSKSAHMNRFLEVWDSDVKTDKELYDYLKPMYEDEAKAMGIAALRVGTNYVTRDQIAYLHEGEAVVPKAYNPAANRNELEVLREKSQSEQMKSREDENESSEYIKLSYGVLQDIKEFLAYWKEDKAKRDSIESAKSKYSPANRFLAGYTTF